MIKKCFHGFYVPRYRQYILMSSSPFFCLQRYGHRNLIEYHLVNKHEIHASKIDSNFKFCFMCTLCDALFPTERVLSLHQEQSHPDEIAQSWALNNSFLRRNGMGGKSGHAAKESAAVTSPKRHSISTMTTLPGVSFPG